MLKFLWLALKSALIIGVAVWVANRPGHITIDWMGYHIQAHIGLALILLAVTAMLASYTGRFFAYIRNFPKIWGRYTYMIGSRKASHNLALGYAHMASGDIKSAQKCLSAARRQLPSNHDHTLLFMLDAQIAKHQGRSDDRHAILTQMAQSHDKTAILGLRALLHDQLEHHDFDGATALLSESGRNVTDQPWAVKFRYALAIEQKDWAQASQILSSKPAKKAIAKKAIDGETSKRDEIALDLLQYDRMKADASANGPDKQKSDQALPLLQQAYRLDPTFPPSIARLAGHYLSVEKPASARKILYKAWKTAPHPDLLPAIDRLYRADNAKKLAKIVDLDKKIAHHVAWYEKLAQKNPDHIETMFMLAQIGLNLKQWPLAHDNLQRAEQADPQSARLYQLFARYELLVNNDDIAQQAYLDKAARCAHDHQWICRETGHRYDFWMPIAPPHNAFNTIIWDTSQHVKRHLFPHLSDQGLTKLEALDG